MLKNLITTGTWAWICELLGQKFRMIPRPKPTPLIVVILGATATGKSNLAVHLASKFNGEIISADSMQVYKGLDILTNKLEEAEMKGVPHHMMSIIDPTITTNFDVHCFQTKALPIVDDILAKGKIPFIVGGTNYYIESLLWKILIQDSSNPDSKPSYPITNTSNLLTSPISKLFESKNGDVNSIELESYDSTELYGVLTKIDPDRAKTTHPNDRRKVIRSLQVYFQTGRRHSEVLNEQFSSDQEKSEVHVGGSLRYPNSLCFWIQVDSEILGKRINDRVDQMVEKGLQQELEAYMDRLRATNMKLDFTRGLLQSIGFKEFNSYLELSTEERSQFGDKVFRECVELLKLHTRQYVKAQLKWINQRFLKKSRKEIPPVYKLDGTSLNLEDWEQNVTTPSERILEAYLSGNDNIENPQLKERLLPVSPYENDLITRTCESCGISLMGNFQWDAHINGNKHKRRLRKRKLREETNISHPSGSSS